MSVLVEKLKGALLVGEAEEGRETEKEKGKKKEEDVSFRTGMGTGILFVQRAK